MLVSTPEGLGFTPRSDKVTAGAEHTGPVSEKKNGEFSRQRLTYLTIIISKLCIGRTGSSAATTGGHVPVSRSCMAADPAPQ